VTAGGTTAGGTTAGAQRRPAVDPRTTPIRMSPIDLLHVGSLGVRTRPARAALSALGIALGIATMVVVTAIPASGQRDLMTRLTALGTNVLVATAREHPPEPAAMPAESVDMVARIGPVTVASAVANTHVAVARTDLAIRDDPAGLAVLASKPNLLQAINARIEDGRFFAAAASTLPTAVLGSVAAVRLGVAGVDASHPPQIFLKDRWFTVIGILATTPLSPDIDRAVLVGWQAARDQLRFDGRPTVIYLQAVESKLGSVRDVLASTIDPANPANVEVSRPSDVLAAKMATQNTFSALFFGLAAVALLVGGLGVANTMIISVLERHREIGLRRALGANRGQIRIQFLTESVLLAGLGGAVGVAMGAGATLGYTAYQHWPTVVPMSAAGGGLLGAMVVGMAAGVYPAVRAARLTPTEALASA
jgi:putative ABC transport system permease protein